MNEVKFIENVLYIGALKVVFENKIMQLKEEEDKVFVLLKIPTKKELNYDDFHNVYCYDAAGKKKWQIGKRPKGDDAAFIMINLIDSKLYANDFLGRRFSVNKENGVIENMNITK